MLNTFPVGPPRPSVNYLVKYVLRKVSTHPLVINQPIRHPLTKERVFINRYKLYSGLVISPGITCAIFPHSTPTDGLSLPKPSDTSTSALFENSAVGNEYVNATYHIALKLYTNEYKLGNKEVDKNIITVPIDAAIHPSQSGFEKYGSKEIEIEINPGLMVISDFLELIRLAILDKEHNIDYPYTPKNIQVLYFNIKEGPWQKGDDIYFQEGEMLVRVDITISTGWRDKFNTNINQVSINMN